jgi:hypothetical protein
MMKTKSFNERGQALILIALAAIGLFAIAGLAIDGSAKYADRRHAQNAADAAALAGALAKSENPPDPLWNIIAQDRALDNGYDDNHVTNEVEVYSPPVSGYYRDNPLYVQVIITSYIDTYFARVIGINRTVNAVQAVALAKKGGPLADGAMLISYNPHPNCGDGSVRIEGNTTVHLTGGGIFLNSQESCGYAAPNCPNLIIDGGGISSAGDNIDQHGCTTAATPYPNQDPLTVPDDVYFPDEPIECNPSMPGTAYPDSIRTDTYHITPGHYTDFPQRTINGDLFGRRQHIIMEPGVYCTDNDVSWQGSTFLSLDGSSGVTIYIKSGHLFKLNIDSPITLYPSDLGRDTDGYLIIQKGTHTNIPSQYCEINGGAYLDLEGIVFAPYCKIKVNGSSRSYASINAQLVGWELLINGGSGISFNYDPNTVVRLKRQVGLMK